MYFDVRRVWLGGCAQGGTLKTKVLSGCTFISTPNLVFWASMHLLRLFSYSLLFSCRSDVLWVLFSFNSVSGSLSFSTSFVSIDTSIWSLSYPSRGKEEKQEKRRRILPVAPFWRMSSRTNWGVLVVDIRYESFRLSTSFSFLIFPMWLFSSMSRMKKCY